MKIKLRLDDPVPAMREGGTYRLEPIIGESSKVAAYKVINNDTGEAVATIPATAVKVTDARPIADDMNTFEQAADECSRVFQRLDEADRRALHVRLLAIGALNAGDIDFIEEMADRARETLLEFVRR